MTDRTAAQQNSYRTGPDTSGHFGIFGGHFVGGSNMFSCWSARREMIARELARGLVHGTGSTVAQYGVAMTLERGE